MTGIVNNATVLVDDTKHLTSLIGDWSVEWDAAVSHLACRRIKRL